MSKRLRYQLTICWPQNKPIKVPITKKGPKGTSLFKVFFLAIIKPIPITAPKKKAKNKAGIILGKPSKKPIKKPNLTSPKPIHLPREIRKMIKKKPAAPKAAPNNPINPDLPKGKEPQAENRILKRL